MKKLLLSNILLLLVLSGCFLEIPTRGTLAPPSQSPPPSLDSIPQSTPEPDALLYVVTAREFLSLRIRPDTSADRVKKLAPGAVVEVSSLDGEFAAVTELCTGYTGYALMKYLAPLPDGQSPPEPAPPNRPGRYRVAAEEFLSLRASPSADAQSLMTIDAGGFVDVRSFWGNFAHVRAGEMEGYVLATYLEPVTREDVPPTPAPEIEYQTEGDIRIMNAKNYGYLRTLPDTTSVRLLKLPRGQRVAVIEEQGEFSRVEELATGERGYVLSRLLVSEEEYTNMPRENKPDIRYADVMEYLTLRASPSMDAKALKTLARGDAVTVLERAGDFAFVVDAKGERGYVLDGYLSKAPVKDTSKEEQFKVSVGEFLSLRAKADSSSKRIEKIPAGETVELLGLDGLFARVRWKGQEGYVLSGYLTAKDADAFSSLDIVKPAAQYAPNRVGEDLSALAKRYPDRLRVISAGKSCEGRDIPVALLGDPEAERHILVQAAIHGREHMTALLAVAQIEEMLARPDASYEGMRYGDLLERVCFHILPMTNPDGVAISQSGRATPALERIYAADKAAGLTDLMLDDYLSGWKANARGVDLNRNFEAGWKNLSGPSAPSSNRYKGEKAGDQSETAALIAYTKKHSFDATVSYHSFGSMIYWEYGVDQAVLEASRSLGRAVRAVTRYPLAGSGGLDAGGYKDWAMEMLSIPSITIETGTRECPLPLDEFDMIWRRNREVLPALAVWALEN